MFYDSEKRQTDLRIRLRYDGMNQSHFFRTMITGYLEKDPNIMIYLDNYKAKHQIQGVNKRAASRRLLRKGEDIKDKFALEEDEIKNIFDIIAEEHPDL
jgi:hypothetical protein